ncbi:peptidase S8/S53 domain-containing protein [Radiomyces spectabilis]|uniref:peptidase S8/S53 domain-containing protein n=1 Tax=Radiomyces spectabilis TaxID=64574 RepID=UPI00221F9164|nr:peptidase S8/S53 domain-containing protein [Radiomyces spectabilis]KAI8381582.1 peptidase S8/S53 domain-containing protein [Radiomyces spectabilis]
MFLPLLSLLTIPLFLLSCLPHTLTAEESILPVRPMNQTDRYIVIFKPNVSHTAIRSHIQQMERHLASSSHSPVNLLANNTAERSSSKLEYSTIGNFRWYSGEFQSRDFGSLLASTSLSMKKASNTSSNVEEGIVHYWVKDDVFSLQEFVQTDPPSWGLDRIDQRHGTDGQYRFLNRKGEGTTVYVLDTGIREDHVDFKDRLTIGKTIVTSDPTDYNGHGTFVAGVCCGTTYGVAKHAKVVSVKTLDDDGNGRLSDLLKGLEWVVQQHIQEEHPKNIINLSVGALYSQATNEAIEEAISLGLHVTVAAGNYGEDACLYSPGSAQGAVTVGAIDEDDSVAYYSNFGKCVDIFAPGTNIKSAWNTGESDSNTLTGTSMAAPHVAGTMALFLSQADYTPFTLANHIKHVSSLITQEFTIDNSEPYYNENKTVLDNAVHDGYHVQGYDTRNPNTSTVVNILFSHPVDGEQFWVFGQTLNRASTASYALSTTLLLVFATLSYIQL